MRKSFALLGLVAFAAMGCSTETISSSDIKTHGIAATIEVIADGDTHSNVWVTLRSGGDESNTYVILDNGDKLTATAGDETKTLSSVEQGKYNATFSTGAENTEFKVVLDRPDDTDAPNNIGTLPAPFGVTPPSGGLSLANDDITITWDHSGSNDMMRLELDGTCIFNFSKSGLSDTGSYTIPKGELSSTGGDKPETCTLKLRMERYRKGSADSALDGESSMEMIQRRDVSFSSAP